MAPKNKSKPRPGARAKTLDAERARRILEAADALFCERGFTGVSMRDVAEGAEVNKALIFYYYENKSALFEAVLDSYYEAHASALKGVAAEGPPLRERLHAIIDAYLGFMDDHRRYAKLIQHEVARSGEHLPLIRKNLGLLFRWIEDALQGLLPKEGPLSAKHFFLSLSAMTINYYTYAPAVRPFWGVAPMSKAARAERREHVHWVVDALLDRLERPEQ